MPPDPALCRCCGTALTQAEARELVEAQHAAWAARAQGDLVADPPIARWCQPCIDADPHDHSWLPPQTIAEYDAEEDAKAARRSAVPFALRIGF